MEIQFTANHVGVMNTLSFSHCLTTLDLNLLQKSHSLLVIILFKQVPYQVDMGVNQKQGISRCSIARATLFDLFKKGLPISIVARRPLGQPLDETDNPFRIPIAFNADETDISIRCCVVLIL